MLIAIAAYDDSVLADGTVCSSGLIGSLAVFNEKDTTVFRMIQCRTKKIPRNLRHGLQLRLRMSLLIDHISADCKVKAGIVLSVEVVTDLVLACNIEVEK